VSIGPFTKTGGSCPSNALLKQNSVGYGSHGDYVFGWKDDSLQRIMDEPCYVTCNSMRTQSMSAMNACKVSDVVGEEINTGKLLTHPILSMQYTSLQTNIKFSKFVNFLAVEALVPALPAVLLASLPWAQPPPLQQHHALLQLLRLLPT
jgi:hypothetical protein